MKTTKTSKKATAKPAKIQTVAKASNDGNPYPRPTSTYHHVFAAGKNGFESRQALAETVGKKIRKAVRLVKIVVDVESNPNHRTNNKRSKAVKKQGKWFLVAC
jgi:hypothetical protein